jgi:hypothetical protein
MFAFIWQRFSTKDTFLFAALGFEIIAFGILSFRKNSENWDSGNRPTRFYSSLVPTIQFIQRNKNTKSVEKFQMNLFNVKYNVIYLATLWSVRQYSVK